MLSIKSTIQDMTSLSLSPEMLELLRNATLVVLSKESFKFVDIPEDEFKELEVFV